MTHTYLIDRTRFLLHDKVEHSDTGSLHWSDDAICDALTDGVAELLKSMIIVSHLPAAERLQIRAANPKWGILAKNALIKEKDISADATLPNDFWIGSCGRTTALPYIPWWNAGEAMVASDLGINTIWADASAASFGGVAALAAGGTAVYYRMPPVIKKSSAVLPYWPDAVYHTVKWLALTNLIMQEERQAPHRWSFFTNEFATTRSILN